MPTHSTGAPPALLGAEIWREPGGRRRRRRRRACVVAKRGRTSRSWEGARRSLYSVTAPVVVCSIKMTGGGNAGEKKGSLREDYAPNWSHPSGAVIREPE